MCWTFKWKLVISLCYVCCKVIVWCKILIVLVFINITMYILIFLS